jgi:hypothetical protein
MTLAAVLVLYEQSIQGLAEHTQETRKSILAAFKATWKHGFDMQVEPEVAPDFLLQMRGSRDPRASSSRGATWRWRRRSSKTDFPGYYC